MTVEEANALITLMKIRRSYNDMPKALCRILHADRLKETYVNALDVAIKSVVSDMVKFNKHEVACILAEAFGDNCACNHNSNDEWLPYYCDFAQTCCPHTDGVACWEQYLTYKDKRGAW